MINLNPNKWQEDENARSITYFAVGEPVGVSRGLIELLRQESQQRGNQNARFCLHHSPNETLHDMIILEHQNKKCRKPHKHLSKDETLHMIDGEMEVFIFNDDGILNYRTTLSPDRNIAFRNPRNQYHLWLPRTDIVVYREIKQGPFDQADNISPDWDYIKALEQHVDFTNIDCYNPGCKTPCKLGKQKAK